MSALIPLDGSAGLPAYLKNRTALAEINADVLATGPSYPVLSTEGKVFTMVKGGERKLLTRIVDGEEEPKPFVTLTVVRANVKSRVFYAKAYEGREESAGARPACYSHDGITPSPHAADPQAKKCQLCPHAVWGSKTPKPGDTEGGKGTACAVNTRLAVIDPEDSTEKPTPFLLRVPAASKKNYAEVVKIANNRSIPYNALVLKVGFDPNETFALTFKPTALLADDVYKKVEAMYDSDEVKEIVGLLEPSPARESEAEKPKVDTSELDEALAKKAIEKAAAKPAAKPAAKAEPAVTVEEVAAVVTQKPKAETKPAAKPPAKPAEDGDKFAALASELDALLSQKDD